jgi:hypothetical protein
MVITAYLKSYEIKNFVETGTYLGDTLAYVSQDESMQAMSVELDDDLYHAAARRFRNWENVTLLHGDSGQIMSEIVDSLKSSATFWLDGHYSGATTAKGDRETPVSAELQATIGSPQSGHVILIDDVRCFDGTHDYPHLDELLAGIRAEGRYNIEISADIFRLTPKGANHEKDTH